MHSSVGFDKDRDLEPAPESLPVSEPTHCTTRGCSYAALTTALEMRPNLSVTSILTSRARRLAGA